MECSSAHLKHRLSRQLLFKLLLMLTAASFAQFRYRTVLWTFGGKKISDKSTCYTWQRLAVRSAYLNCTSRKENSPTPTFSEEEFFYLWLVYHFETKTVSSMCFCCSTGWNQYIIFYTKYHAWFGSGAAHIKKDKSYYERLPKKLLPKKVFSFLGLSLSRFSLKKYV